MHRSLTIKQNDLSPFLKCPLCKGYFIDAFTINECLHSFCKSCIVKYIKRKECCPVCKTNITKEKINIFLRRDINLQYIVYKLVPGLFKNEMERRRQFYETHPKAVKYLKKKKIYDKEAIGELSEDIFRCDNHSEISLSLEYSETGLSEICDSIRRKQNDEKNPKCYLQCPATFTIELLKKFLKYRFDLKTIANLDIMYDDKPLNKDFTLMDVAYIYAWRRTAPMRLFYRLNLQDKTNQEEILKQIIEKMSQLTYENQLKINEKPPIELKTESEILSKEIEIKPVNSLEKNEKPIDIELNETTAKISNEKMKLSQININTQDLANKEKDLLNKSLNSSLNKNENAVNNKENDDSMTSIATNVTTTKLNTTNNTIINNINTENHLTITAMMASLTNSNKQLEKEKHSKESNIKESNQNEKLSNSISSTKLNKLQDTISNSDKENEENPNTVNQPIINNLNTITSNESNNPNKSLIDKKMLSEQNNPSSNILNNNKEANKPKIDSISNESTSNSINQVINSTISTLSNNINKQQQQTSQQIQKKANPPLLKPKLAPATSDLNNQLSTKFPNTESISSVNNNLNNNSLKTNKKKTKNSDPNDCASASKKPKLTSKSTNKSPKSPLKLITQNPIKQENQPQNEITNTSIKNIDTHELMYNQQLQFAKQFNLPFPKLTNNSTNLNNSSNNNNNSSQSQNQTSQPITQNHQQTNQPNSQLPFQLPMNAIMNQFLSTAVKNNQQSTVGQTQSQQLNNINNSNNNTTSNNNSVQQDNNTNIYNAWKAAASFDYTKTTAQNQFNFFNPVASSNPAAAVAAQSILSAAQAQQQQQQAQINANPMQSLMNQKYATTFFDFLQTKAQQTYQNQNYYSNPVSNPLHQQYLAFTQKAVAAAALNQNYHFNQINNHHIHQHQQNGFNFLDAYSNTSYKQLNSSNLNNISNSSNCSTESSGLDSLKETQLKISESCNLVNE